MTSALFFNNTPFLKTKGAVLKYVHVTDKMMQDSADKMQHFINSL